MSLINNYTFLKIAAISTDYENIRNNSWWHPYSILGKAQRGVDNLFKNKDTDNTFVKGLKGLSRFALGDVALGLGKNVVGALDPVRPLLSGYDALLGRISGKEFLGRLGDQAQDALWTALTAASAGTAGAGAKAALTGMKGFIPGTSRYAAKSIVKNTNKALKEQLKNIKDPAQKEQLIKKHLNMALFNPKTNGNKDLVRSYFAKNLKSYGLSKDQAKQFTRTNLSNLRNADRYTASKYLGDNYSFRELNKMRSDPSITKGAVRDAMYRKVLHNPVILYPMLAEVAGTTTGLIEPNSTLDKTLSFPTKAFSMLGEASRDARTAVSQDFIKDLKDKSNIPQNVIDALYTKNQSGDYILNDELLREMANSISNNSDEVDKDQIFSLLRRVFTPDSSRTLEYLPYWSAGLGQMLGDDTLSNNHGLSFEDRSQILNSLR